MRIVVTHLISIVRKLPAFTHAPIMLALLKPTLKNRRRRCAYASEQQPNPSTDLQAACVQLDRAAHGGFRAGVQGQFRPRVPRHGADTEMRSERPGDVSPHVEAD